MVPAPDRRRPPLDAEHERPARQDLAHQGQGRRHRGRRRQQGRPRLGHGAYTIPAGNLFPLVAGAPQARTRPEIYAMGFRNPFRIQVDENDVAYVTDYSPDAQAPQRGRGPAGVGRVEIVRKPSNYGYPLCYSSKLGYYRWNFQRVRRRHAPRVGTPLDNPPQPVDCARRPVVNDSRWVARRRPGASSPACARRRRSPIRRSGTPTATTTRRPRSARRARRTTRRPRARSRPGSTTECPRLFPELFTGGVGPHGAAKYHYDPANPSTTKFPPYYDDSVVFGEFKQDTLREVKLDSQNRVFKINSFLDCGARPTSPTRPVAFECDNPMDMQFGADGTLLPDDLRRRLLHHQPGRRHVQVGLRQGPARARWPCSAPTRPTARCR